MKKRFYINLDYTQTPAKLAANLHTKDSKTLFLSFCMHATGVRRLFCEHTTNEFLYRLGLILRHFDLISNFFTDDTFVRFKDEDIQMEFCLEDLISNLGIELWSGADDFIEREYWMKHLDIIWKNANKKAAIEGIPMIDKKRVGKNFYAIGSNSPLPITEEAERNAKLFAQEAMKSIGKNEFLNLSIRVSERKKYLEEYRTRLAEKPKHTYCFEKISMEVKKQFFETIFCPIKKSNKKNIQEEINEPKSVFAALLHLAWLWHNGYVKTFTVSIGGNRHAFGAEVDERIEFDYNLYDGMNPMEIGVNLYETFHHYHLDKVEALLKEKE